MATSGQDADAAFFNLMHHFLAASHKDEAGAGRDDSRAPGRSKSRRAFRLTQRIAPGYCWEVPPESAWIDVRCYDLAQAGFSFFLDEKPTFDQLVAMFRSAEPIFVAARVNHSRLVLVDGWGGILDPSIPSSGAISTLRRTESKFLVGCEFLRRFTP
ncbi:MAG: hypothetical protein ACLP9L_21600 [Thermoguttaceae bacterium]